MRFFFRSVLVFSHAAQNDVGWWDNCGDLAGGVRFMQNTFCQINECAAHILFVACYVFSIYHCGYSISSDISSGAMDESECVGFLCSCRNSVITKRRRRTEANLENDKV